MSRSTKIICLIAVLGTLAIAVWAFVTNGRALRQSRQTELKSVKR